MKFRQFHQTRIVFIIKMLRIINYVIWAFLFMLVSASCFKKWTCPAYQSQYLMDEQVFRNKFSLFNADSTPKNPAKVKKDKHGIIVQKSYISKNVEMKIIPMVKIYPVTVDTVQMIASADTLGLDSLVLKRPSKYMTTVNNDQLIYNTLYGSLLVKEEKKPQNLKEELKVKPLPVQPALEEDTLTKKSKFRIFRKKEVSEKETEEIRQKPARETPKPVEQIPEDDGF